jgi:hypothetical protein
MTPMAKPTPAGKSGMDAHGQKKDAAGHRRNFPEPMEEKDETMEDEAPPQPMPAPPPPPPSFSTIKVRPPAPPADTKAPAVIPAPTPDPLKAAPAHDK